MKTGRKSALITVMEEGRKIFSIRIDRLGRICDMEPRLGNIFSDYRGRQIQATGMLHNIIYRFRNEEVR